jgi:hypothetical protein
MATPTVVPAATQISETKPSLDVPRQVSSVFTSKRIIGIGMALYGIVANRWPDKLPNALAIEGLVNQMVTFGGLALTTWGSFTAKGPVGFVFGGGVSQATQLAAQGTDIERQVREIIADLHARNDPAVSALQAPPAATTVNEAWDTAAPARPLLGRPWPVSRSTSWCPNCLTC